jgi:hypothetical protein
VEKPKEKEKESKSKDKSSSKEKKEKEASSPTSKKSSFRAHLVNHKKLFKVPDIDLNNLKLSCLFSSTRNMAIGHSKNRINTTPPKTPTSAAPETPPAGAKKSKSADNIFSNKPLELKEKKIVRQEKQPAKSEKPVKPEKPEKSVEKSEKLEKFEKMQQKERDRTVNSRSSGMNVQSSSENFVEDTSAHSNSISDVEYEVI